FADLEWPPVDLGRKPAVVNDVGDEVAEPAPEAGAAGFERALERRRVADERIGRRHRFGEQRKGELAARPALWIEVHPVHQAEHRFGPGEVALHQPAIDRVIAEGWIGKSPVRRVRLSLARADNDLTQLASERAGAAAQRLGVSERARSDLASGGQELRAIEGDEWV